MNQITNNSAISVSTIFHEKYSLKASSFEPWPDELFFAIIRHLGTQEMPQIMRAYKEVIQLPSNESLPTFINKRNNFTFYQSQRRYAQKSLQNVDKNIKVEDHSISTGQKVFVYEAMYFHQEILLLYLLLKEGNGQTSELHNIISEALINILAKDKSVKNIFNLVRPGVDVDALSEKEKIHFPFAANEKKSNCEEKKCFSITDSFTSWPDELFFAFISYWGVQKRLQAKRSCKKLIQLSDDITLANFIDKEKKLSLSNLPRSGQQEQFKEIKQPIKTAKYSIFKENKNFLYKALDSRQEKLTYKLYLKKANEQITPRNSEKQGDPSSFNIDGNNFYSEQDQQKYSLKKSLFESWPDELFLAILRYLSAEEMRQLRLVCKKFAQLSRDESLPVFIDEKKDPNVSSLQWFCRQGQLKRVKQIIEAKDPSILDPFFKEQQNFLSEAVRSRQEEVVQYLLSKGADAQISDCNSKRRSTPLHLATKRGLMGITARLLEHGADINAIDKKWKTPLHYTIGKKRFYAEIIKLLLAKGADLHVAGTLPFIYHAIEVGNFLATKKLLKLDKKRQEEGCSPLLDLPLDVKDFAKQKCKFLPNKNSTPERKARYEIMVCVKKYFKQLKKLERKALKNDIYIIPKDTR
ncbi:ankyrin repeat domain-containing protein [Neochlamydia sp. AcF95]|uniref:ankyrin repeat domain-containing protein n=1 Tax=Neochlamydia sp. AcF95 TaxID=2795734 RepID=UPI001BC9FA3A|nr:ankyrin repeat domain-containing protein [Neochlamydia sp. AcF95]